MKKWTRVMYQPNRPLKEGCYVTASKEHIALSTQCPVVEAVETVSISRRLMNGQRAPDSHPITGLIPN